MNVPAVDYEIGVALPGSSDPRASFMVNLAEGGGAFALAVGDFGVPSDAPFDAWVIDTTTNPWTLVNVD